MKHLLFLVAILASYNEQSAWGASGGDNGYVGLMGGVSFPSLSSVTFASGATVMYRPEDFYGYGIFIHHYGASVQTTTSLGSASASSNSLVVGGQGDLFFWGSLTGFRVGLRMGLVVVSSSFTATDGTTTITLPDNITRWFFMPTLGYDYFLGRISVGAEVEYLISVGDNAPSAFLFFFAPKFWF